MADISLNNNSKLSPTILNGNNINQIIGNRKIINMANGQQMINRKHQRIIAIIVLIAFSVNQLTNK